MEIALVLVLVKGESECLYSITVQRVSAAPLLYESQLCDAT